MKYNRYLKIKSSLKIKYKGFYLSKVASMDIVGMVYSQNFHFLRFVYLLSRVENLNELNKKIKSNHPLYTYYTNRDDYLELVKKYMTKLGDKEDIICFENIKMKKRSNLKHFFTSLFSAFRTKETSFIEKLMVAAILAFHKSQIDELLSINMTIPKKYYAFNSSTRIETLLTLYFQKYNVPTYSMQHGIYYNYKSDIIDLINLENFVADKMLCWGEYSINELKKFGIDEDRLEFFSNPKYNYTVKYVKPTDEIECVLVFLARESYEEGNKRLIYLLSSFQSIKFKLKLHPSSKLNTYKNFIVDFDNIEIIEKNMTIQEVFRYNYDLVLTYNTTVHYEAQLFGKLTFGYDYMADGGILFESFSSKEDLIKLINKYEKLNAKDINQKISEFVDYTLGIKKVEK